MENTAQKTADEKRKLPAKLVRDWTHDNAPDEKTGEYNGGWYETQRSSIAHQVELWIRRNITLKMLRHWIIEFDLIKVLLPISDIDIY